MKDPDAKRPAQQLDEALEKAKIDNELVESLNEGLRSFGESGNSLIKTVSAAAGISDIILKYKKELKI